MRPIENKTRTNRVRGLSGARGKKVRAGREEDFQELLQRSEGEKPQEERPEEEGWRQDEDRVELRGAGEGDSGGTQKKNPDKPPGEKGQGIDLKA